MLLQGGLTTGDRTMADLYYILAYATANVALVMICGVLAGLSFSAYYRRPGQRSYLLTGLGFSSIGLAALGESMYTLVVEREFLLSSSEFLLLQAGEDIFSALGLGLLFLAIVRHQPGSSEAGNIAASSDEQKYWESETPFEE